VKGVLFLEFGFQYYLISQKTKEKKNFFSFLISYSFTKPVVVLMKSKPMQRKLRKRESTFIKRSFKKVLQVVMGYYLSYFFAVFIFIICK